MSGWLVGIGIVIALWLAVVFSKDNDYSPRAQAIAIVVAVVFGLVVLTVVQEGWDKRGDDLNSWRREAIALGNEADRADRLEDKLAAVRARLPKVEDRAYQRGRADGIADTCNATYGDGPTLEGVVLRDGSIGDTWSRSYGEFAIIRAIVVVVSLEDGSSYRIARSDCMRLT